MRNGQPTAPWPTEIGKYYIHVLYHEFFYGPYISLEALREARDRMSDLDPMWNYDPDATVMGDDTPEDGRSTSKLIYVDRDTGRIMG